jgi:multicomponent Na+:H+ antiporter subunit E
MIRSIALFIAMVLIWLLWSGLYIPLLLFLGLASCILVVWLMNRFESIDHESVPIQLGLPILTYWIWLIKEILVSSIQVSQIILSSRIEIQPQLVKVKSQAQSDVGLVIFGNSITLTPGTFTTSIDDDGTLTVHALTQDGADGLLEGSMNRRVGALDRSTDHA